MKRLPKTRVTRREILAAGGVAGAGLLLGCGDSDDAGTTTGTAPGVSNTASTATQGSNASTAGTSCTLTPEQEEGPFYLDLNKLRRDIVEDRAGTPLRLRVKVVDSDSCEPIANAPVDIWHCDSVGTYSGEASQATTGTTYLRGIQVTDEDGLVEFRTIYPRPLPGPHHPHPRQGARRRQSCRSEVFGRPRLAHRPVLHPGQAEREGL